MAERKIVGRKSQMFLHSVLPVIKTHNEVVKEKFKRGKFPVTTTGIIKIIGILILLISLAIFISNPICSNTPEWYPYALPAVLGAHIILSVLLYTIFSFGIITNSPAIWIKIDISINLSLSTTVLIVSVMSMVSCNSLSTLLRIPMILGLCGSGTLIISCAALFLLYRYTEDPELDIPQHNPPPTNSRKSIFA